MEKPKDKSQEENEGVDFCILCERKFNQHGSTHGICKACADKLEEGRKDIFKKQQEQEDRERLMRSTMK